ncbi:YcxB family protein [Paenibacillus dakarensis]|uniref:YcxB family protein n=1 Tax=Paenibacillus dakarensis TaxID=1527293 RepID=UPI0006D52E29|nr:YcxB family protein [Paenibacillus dakarensis]
MNNSETLSVVIQLTQKHYAYFIRLHQKKSLIFSFFFYVLLFIAVMLSRNDFEFETAIVVIGLVGGIITSTIVLICMYFLTQYQSFKHFRSDKLLQQKQNYEISDSGISVSSDSGTAHIQWNEIYKAAESKHIIALYTGKGRALVLPIDMIDNQVNQGTEQLKAIIRKNVSGNKINLAS